MGYKVIRSSEIDRDLDQILDFLVSAAEAFGEGPERAIAQAEKRLFEIEDAIEGLGATPHQGTLRPALGTGMRNATKGRAVIYFDVDDDLRLIRILAVFYGGQDHESRILLRLLTGHSSREP